MRRLIILLFLLLNSVYAQNEIINSPFLIASSGDTWMQDNYILCFSVGELVIDTKIQDGIILTQGFHQEENYQITAINEILNNYVINMYPNPTSGILNIHSNEAIYADIEIKDIRGGIIKSISKTLLHNNYYIDLSSFSSGVYFLEVLFSSSKKQVYKIQKFN
tara:strand:+ start:290 stop:778 length:489 start_codon:yes stop_codon:yes gene_type:complete